MRHLNTLLLILISASSAFAIQKMPIPRGMVHPLGHGDSVAYSKINESTFANFKSMDKGKNGSLSVRQSEKEVEFTPYHLDEKPVNSRVEMTEIGDETHINLHRNFSGDKKFLIQNHVLNRIENADVQTLESFATKNMTSTAILEGKTITAKVTTGNELPSKYFKKDIKVEAPGDVVRFHVHENGKEMMVITKEGDNYYFSTYTLEGEGKSNGFHRLKRFEVVQMKLGLKEKPVRSNATATSKGIEIQNGNK